MHVQGMHCEEGCLSCEGMVTGNGEPVRDGVEGWRESLAETTRMSLRED